MKTPGSQFKICIITALKNRSPKIVLRTINFLLILFCCCNMSFAGAITIDPTPLSDGTVGQAKSATFNLTAGSDMVTPVTWAINPADMPALTAAGLIFNAATHSITTTGNGMGNVLPIATDVVFRVDVVNQDNSGQDEHQFTLHINRLPVDLMLVLDNSASMNCCYNQTPVDPTCVSCGLASNSRLAQLKIAVDEFFSLGTMGADPYFHTSDPDATKNDRFGTVIFSGILDVSHVTYSSNPNSLNTFIQGIGTSGGTCIGGGLLTAITSMTAQSMANHNKSLLLFTDGEQNYNPMLKNIAAPVTYESGPLAVHPYDPSAPNPPYGDCMSFPASTPIFNTAFRTTSPGIKVSTIGFELPAGPGNQLLSNLADNINGPGGTTNISGTGAADFDFATFFGNAFTELLSGSSPQILKEEKGVTKEGLNSTSFVINDTVQKITFILTGNALSGDSLRFRVKKNNEDVTRYGFMINKPGYNMWTLEFPIRGEYNGSASIRPGGEWVVETTTQSGVKYDAMCIVDDHLMKYNCSFGSSSNHVVGDPIPLSVSLKYKGKPIKDFVEVTVLIERSNDDGGTALAQLPTPKELQTIFKNKSAAGSNVIDPSYDNLGQIKHYALLQTEPKYVQALTATTDKVILTSNGDGTFSGTYIPKVTGPHRFTFLIDGKDSAIGEYHRTVVQSSVVRLAHFTLSTENVKVEAIKENDQTVGYNINLIIKDSSGLLLGPAFGNSFVLESSSGKFSNVTDNLDGSYSVSLNSIGNNIDPDINISVDGVKYYVGKVSQIGQKETSKFYLQWWFWLILVIILLIIIFALRKKSS
jgi:hypothetical protein